jgi:hypothetical protein
MSGIPYPGTAELERVARRTTVVRTALAVAAVVLLVAAALVAWTPRLSTERFLPARTNSGLIVLDLSASVSSDTFSRIGTTLRALSERNGRYGLVVFSNSAYEALPPGTPAAALKPIVRYFTLPTKRRPGTSLNFPTNPWAISFTSGTRISTGLALARSLAAANGVARTPVILVSDLADDSGDVPRLTSELLAYRRLGIALRVVPLNAASEDSAFFQRLLGTASAVLPAPPPTGETTAVRGAFPIALAALALAAIAVLAAIELWRARLEWAPAGEAT